MAKGNVGSNPIGKDVKDLSPTGEALLFMLADTIQCFVPPKGGLRGRPCSKMLFGF